MLADRSPDILQIHRSTATGRAFDHRAIELDNRLSQRSEPALRPSTGPAARADCRKARRDQQPPSYRLHGPDPDRCVYDYLWVLFINAYLIMCIVRGTDYVRTYSKTGV